METKETGSRIIALDYMKAILVAGMIFAHTFQLWFAGRENLPGFVLETIDSLKIFFRATTFPSFLFCFGYVFYVAYLEKFTSSRMKLFKNGLNTLIAYYISACGVFAILHHDLCRENIQSIVLLNPVIIYSEFLLAFAIIPFLCILFGNVILKIISSSTALCVVSLGLLSAALVMPYDHIGVHLGLLIGTSKMRVFPVLLYMPYFLLGAYVSKNKIIFSKRVLFITLALSVAGITFSIVNQSMPSRFPPSFFWLILPAGYTYLLYLFCCMLGKYNLGSYVKRLGANTLFYLISSNLILIFWMENIPAANYHWLYSFALFVMIMFVSDFMIRIVRR